MFLIGPPNKMNDPCANHLCGFRYRKGQPARGKYYHTSEKMWVCTSCAQTENREAFGKATKYAAKYSAPCISSEDALALILAGQMAQV